jgi:hypothetical protein
LDKLVYPEISSTTLTGEETKEFARRLRRAAGADPSASGGTRIAGTTNYKRKCESDFPAVRIVDAAPGLIVTQSMMAAQRRLEH